jgi:hypothetical protein
MAEPLRVKLRDLVVGELELHGNSVRFHADPSYVAADPRPILGQIFEEDPERIRPSHHRLAPWFSNLLPEKGGPTRSGPSSAPPTTSSRPSRTRSSGRIRSP